MKNLEKTEINVKNMGKKIRFLCIAITIVVTVALLGCGKTEPVSFHTEKQEAYLNDDYKNYKLYANGTDELSKPEAVTLNFSDVKGDAFVVLVSEKEDLSDAKRYETNENSLNLFNLKVNTTYYWKAYANGSDESKAKVRTLSTDAKAPRNLLVEGVTNARDIGGWKIDDTTFVKQGMIFRTGKYNSDESAELLITEAGITVLKDELGVKTEIDLRTVEDNENGGITKSPLGDGVTYYSVPFQSGGNIILLNKDCLKDLFEIFGDENNYPIAFHCSIGTDRTGCVAFLINGLLGVSKEDLYRDFLFSNFGEIGSMRAPSIVKTYMDTVDMAAGSTLSEKIYNYLVSEAGVAPENLDTIKRLLTEAR